MVRARPGGEDDLIQNTFAPLAAGFPGALGLKDDCALLAPPDGEDLVLTTDAVAEGVHFFADDAPGDIAWKALAVNVSDLTAKGAPARLSDGAVVPVAAERGLAYCICRRAARSSGRVFHCARWRRYGPPARTIDGHDLGHR
jgi:hypothetical protein